MALTDKQEVNPYAAPETFGIELPFYSPAEHVVCAVSRSWLYRWISFLGPTPLEIVYQGRSLGYESVVVNGRVLGRSSARVFAYVAPRIDFELGGHGRNYRASIEVRTSLWPDLRLFRLVIDDRVAYSEGNW